VGAPATRAAFISGDWNLQSDVEVFKNAICGYSKPTRQYFLKLHSGVTAVEKDVRNT
jgi:hypothetical protein